MNVSLPIKMSKFHFTVIKSFCNVGISISFVPFLSTDVKFRAWLSKNVIQNFQNH